MPSYQARVLVIYTGGTLGMVLSDLNDPSSPLEPGTLVSLRKCIVESIPGLGFSNIELEYAEFPLPPFDSADCKPSYWIEIARVIRNHYDDFDGFVVLHGTDTMAHTASGLSFVLENLAKPVVITGSQLPLSDVRSDGRLNLINSIQVAGYLASELPKIPEVVLCFGDSLLRGNRATKVSTRAINGYASPNYPRLGELGEGIVIRSELLRPCPDNTEKPFQIREQQNANVIDLGISPGLSAAQLMVLVENETLAGIVIRSYGSGNVPQELIPVLRKAVEQQKLVVNVTQCHRGRVAQGLYQSSFKLAEAGVCSGSDMTPEAALAKCIWLLGSNIKDDLKSQMERDHRGEQSRS